MKKVYSCILIQLNEEHRQKNMIFCGVKGSKFAVYTHAKIEGECSEQKTRGRRRRWGEENNDELTKAELGFRSEFGCITDLNERKSRVKLYSDIH